MLLANMTILHLWKFDTASTLYSMYIVYKVLMFSTFNISCVVSYVQNCTSFELTLISIPNLLNTALYILVKFYTITCEYLYEHKYVYPYF